jgi:hypothetical protein
MPDREAPSFGNAQPRAGLNHGTAGAAGGHQGLEIAAGGHCVAQIIEDLEIGPATWLPPACISR